MAKINSLSDAALDKIRRDLQQVRNATTNLRRHLAHVGARHREAVWMPGGGADVVSYRESFLVKPAGYTDHSQEFPDSGGSSYRAALAYDETVGSESEVGITHDNSVAYPFIDGNFTATKQGVYLCWFSIRVSYDFGFTMTNGACVPFKVSALRKTSTDSFVSNASNLEWYVMYNSSYSQWTPEYQTASNHYVIPLEVGDKIALRCEGISGYQSGNGTARAKLSQSEFSVMRIKDTYENLWGWYDPDA